MNHRFTWRGYCAFEIEAKTVGDAVQKAIADKPSHIPAGTGLFYGMAGGSNKGAVYVVPGQERYINSKLASPYTLSIWSDEKIRITNTNTGKTVRTFASEKEAQDYIGIHYK